MRKLMGKKIPQPVKAEVFEKIMKMEFISLLRAFFVQISFFQLISVEKSSYNVQISVLLNYFYTNVFD